MKRRWLPILLCLLIVTAISCDNVLNPEPVDLLVNEVVLNEPADVPNAEIGMYAAFRNIVPVTVIAGDLTADMLVFNGTFTQYRELGNKQITPANGSAAALWRSIYNTIYLCNFVLERVPEISGVRTADREKALGTAHFLRGMSYFYAINTYGAVPKVTSTSIQENRTIPRASTTDIIDLITEDFEFALENLPEQPVNVAFAGKSAVRAALARFSLYQQDWSKAESYASQVIESGYFQLDSAYSDIVTTDFPKESIFEMGYTTFDDPGTDATYGLQYLFLGRREIIPSNEAARTLVTTTISGERRFSISFNPNNQKGSDNGWSVAKYGTADSNNNNVIVFRLGEMYLIRAEARAHLGKVTGTNSAQSDINILRLRADEYDAVKKTKRYNVPLVANVSQADMFSIIESERFVELAYEGHRWYDLVRTGKANTVMPSFSANWKTAYVLWPIPQREINNNTALKGNQNPGY